MDECEHDFVFGGTKYSIGHQMAGTSAKRVKYFDWFYCRKCLEQRRSDYYPGDFDTYGKTLFNATPIGNTEIHRL